MTRKLHMQVLATILVITISSVLPICYPYESLVTTIQTDKGKYNLEETVRIDGTVTYNANPVSDALVALQVNDPMGDALMYRTRDTGNPPETSTIEIVEILPSDEIGNPKLFFTRGGFAYFKVTWRNNRGGPRSVVVTLNCYYEPYEAPFEAIIVYFGSIQSYETITWIQSVIIPDDAPIGDAKVYACAYSNLPESVGFPWCPEKSAAFAITSSGGGLGMGLGTTSTTLDKPVEAFVQTLALGASPAGTYSLTFEVPSQAMPGNYTAYASAKWSGLSDFDYAEFKVTLLPRLRVTPRNTFVESIDEIFEINIDIADVTDLASWSFKLYYNSTTLNSTQIVEGPFLETAGNTSFVIHEFTDSYNSTHGRIWATCSLTDGGSGANGSGTLATVTFKTKVLGTSFLRLSETELMDSNTLPASIQHTTIDGLVSIGVHDVAISEVEPYKTIVGDPSTLEIFVTIQNQGNYTETFNVTVYANTTLIKTQGVTVLSRSSTILTVTWSTTGSLKYKYYTISAEASPVSGEIDMEDNTYVDGKIRIVITADVNADKIVDLFDAVMLAGAAGARPGYPNWNPNIDLNNDRTIDIFDAVILSGHAGETWP